MGSNNGTGQPNYFRCSQCRKVGGGRNTGWLGQVELTGRRREHRGNVGARITNIDREYVCGSCGHTGWSAHIDLCDVAGDNRLALWRNGAIVIPSYALSSDGSMMRR